MITITHFTASWLFPTLWFIGAMLFFGFWLKRKEELAAVPPAIGLYLSLLIYIVWLFIWVIKHWNQFHIIPKIFNVQG